MPLKNTTYPKKISPHTATWVYLKKSRALGNWGLKNTVSLRLKISASLRSE